MLKKYSLVALSLLLILLSACKDTPPAETVVVETPEKIDDAPESTATAVENEEELPNAALPSGILISELLLAVPGDNQQEFIELYNSTEDVQSLAGWSLWYRLKEGQDEQLVIAWEDGDEIPGLGHYLLGHGEQDVGLLLDSLFDLNLSERKGGLLLRDASGEVADMAGWGEDSPQGYFAGEAAVAPENGVSLERLPGGDAGNGQNSGNNATDFVALAVPNPQNSGSSITPLPTDFLSLSLAAPAVVEPGTEFVLTVEVVNVSETAVSNATISIPIATHFELFSMPDGAELTDGRLMWNIPQMAANGSQTAEIRLRSPFSYIDTLIKGAFATTDGYVITFAPLKMVAMAGGSVPIATARTLEGSTVSIEGVATMYTGGLYAGSTGTKFYIEDETGGVQVFVPGGLDELQVTIGDRLRVTGVVTLYRDSIEVIPDDFSTDIELIEQGAAWEATTIPIAEYQLDDEVIGRLTTIEGTAVRIEEFTYSYEMDIADEAGNITLLYIDKLTGVSAEPYDVGSQYQVTGISEYYSGRYQIYPRLQGDISEQFPPILKIDLDAPNNVFVAGEMDVTITVQNYTDETMTNVQIRTSLPQGAVLSEILDGGVLESGTIVWNVEELSADGGFATVSYRLAAEAELGEQILVAPASATAEQWPQEATTAAFSTFVGNGVPVWAIQGDGFSSPYVRDEVSTSGVVTAVFPDLGGFWLQDLFSDDNPATSDAVFVLLDDGLRFSPAVGDLLDINGRVRELSGQTTLFVQADADIMLNSPGYTNVFEPVPYHPPSDVAEALVYNESLEGMLVIIDEPARVVAPTTKYGEFVMVYASEGVESVLRTAAVGYLMFGDDGSSITHEDESTQPIVVTVGDTISGLMGPLAYTFDNYKIEPLVLPEIVTGERPLATIRPAAENEFSIATFNVENLFDTKPPYPSSPEPLSDEQYAQRLNKIAEAILAMGAPTIIGLQEVENIGVLEDLAAQEQLAAFDYQPALIEGLDSRGIDVGYLVRSDVATILEVEQFLAPDGIASRPPLLVKVAIETDSGSQTVYVLNNHFSSLASGEAATEPRRTAQAAWNVEIMAQLLADDPDAQFVVLGDLNSFYQTPPLDTLQAAGLRHVYEFLPDEERPYTYIFQGRTQTLDHILLSPQLFDRLVLVDGLQINADYPIGNPEDISARRASDHDPLLVIIAFE
jgi:predicted extracellular nuclease